MSETECTEYKFISTEPSGPRPRPPLSRMNGGGRKSSRKHSQSRLENHYRETRKTRNDKHDDDETFDSESNSSTNKSRDTSNSESKRKSPINQNSRTTEQRSKQRKTVAPPKSSPRTKSVPHRVWEKDINHIAIPRRWLFIIFILTLFGVIAYEYTIGFNNSISKNNITQFEKDIEYVKKKFPMQMPDIWDDFFTGVKTVIEESSKRPAVFILVANNSNTIDCLSISLGNVISRSLGGKECLILGPKNFVSNFGETIEWLKPKIEQKRVVVINDILKVSSEALRSFHWLCDDTNPLVSRAIYLITMTINRLHVEQNNLTKLVEEQIYNTFSKTIQFDTLHALVSRITSGAILPILSEPNVTHGTECS